MSEWWQDQNAPDGWQCPFCGGHDITHYGGTDSPNDDFFCNFCGAEVTKKMWEAWHKSRLESQAKLASAQERITELEGDAERLDDFLTLHRDSYLRGVAMCGEQVQALAKRYSADAGTVYPDDGELFSWLLEKLAEAKASEAAAWRQAELKADLESATRHDMALVEAKLAKCEAMLAAVGAEEVE